MANRLVNACYETPRALTVAIFGYQNLAIWLGKFRLISMLSGQFDIAHEAQYHQARCRAQVVDARKLLAETAGATVDRCGKEEGGDTFSG